MKVPGPGDTTEFFFFPRSEKYNLVGYFTHLIITEALQYL